MKFAALFSRSGQKLHVGCVLSAGDDWIEVSVPPGFKTDQPLQLMLYPSEALFPVKEVWRRPDCVGLAYVAMLPTGDDLRGVTVFKNRLQDRIPRKAGKE